MSSMELSDAPVQTSEAETLFWKFMNLAKSDAGPNATQKEKYVDAYKIAGRTITDPEEAEKFLIGCSEFIDKYYPIDTTRPEYQEKPWTSMDNAIATIKQFAAARVPEADIPNNGKFEDIYGALPEAFQIAVDKIENNSFASLAR